MIYHLQFRDWIKSQHDIECNQKYNKTLPYSFHLGLVANFAVKFKHLIPDTRIINHQNERANHVNLRDIVIDGAWGHDLIEDARVTYNDVRDKAGKFYGNSVAGEMLADIVYSCTELKGRDRHERHGNEYLQGLKRNKYGLFVKLCDIQANVSYGVMTNSSMVKKYRSEYDDIIKPELYTPEYAEIFKNLELILTLK